MIERRIVILFVVALFVVVSSLIILQCIFSLSLQDILQELLLSAVTGCVFAFPAAITYVIFENQRLEKKKISLLNILEKTLTEFDVRRKETQLDTTLQSIQDIYYQLLELQNSYFAKDSMHIQALESDLFMLRNILLSPNIDRVDLQKDYERYKNNCLSNIHRILGHSMLSRQNH